MLKKFVSSLLAVLLIAGCSAGTDGEMVLNHKPVAEMADGLVQTLGMSELKEVKERVMYGMFFETRKDAEDNFVTDGRVYRGEDKNADTVYISESSLNVILSVKTRLDCVFVIIFRDLTICVILIQVNYILKRRLNNFHFCPPIHRKKFSRSTMPFLRQARTDRSSFWSSAAKSKKPRPQSMNC